MIQIKNVTKTYSSGKNGKAQVRALDGVSLDFPERGMVFLLGKSGSGKSTLLNVCGGLDTPTEGEIVVKGRSSKTFSQSDFDSYRNTYIGFKIHYSPDAHKLEQFIKYLESISKDDLPDIV